MTKAEEQTPLWGLPDRASLPDIRVRGSVLVLRLSPALAEALHQRTEDPVLDRLVLKVLHEWADVPEET